MSQLEAMKSHLKGILVQGVDETLEKLGDIISSNSELFDDYILLSSAYNSLYKEIEKGIIDEAEKRISLNKVRDQIIFLISRLGYDDINIGFENGDISEWVEKKQNPNEKDVLDFIVGILKKYKFQLSAEQQFNNHSIPTIFLSQPYNSKFIFERKGYLEITTISNHTEEFRLDHISVEKPVLTMEFTIVSIDTGKIKPAIRPQARFETIPKEEWKKIQEEWTHFSHDTFRFRTSVDLTQVGRVFIEEKENFPTSKKYIEVILHSWNHEEIFLHEQLRKGEEEKIALFWPYYSKTVEIPMMIKDRTIAEKLIKSLNYIRLLWGAKNEPF